MSIRKIELEAEILPLEMLWHYGVLILFSGVLCSDRPPGRLLVAGKCSVQ